MSGRNPQVAAYRQMHDLRTAARDMERELSLLQAEQRRMEADIAATLQQRSANGQQRFWRGFLFALFAVVAAWGTAAGMAHALVNP